MFVWLLKVIVLLNIISCYGIKLTFKKDLTHEGKHLPAQLHCAEDKNNNNEISALVNMSIYKISQPEGNTLLASISESDAKPQGYETDGVQVDGKMSKYYGELTLSFSNYPECNTEFYMCTEYFINSTGSVMKAGKMAECFDKKSRDSILMMNLRAKTPDILKTVDRMTDFLKSFEDPKNGADAVVSVNMSHTDRIFYNSNDIHNFNEMQTSNDMQKMTRDLNTDHNKHQSHCLDGANQVDDKIRDALLKVNATLQRMEININVRIEAKIKKTLEKQGEALESVWEKISQLNSTIQTLREDRQEDSTLYMDKLNTTEEMLGQTLHVLAELNRTMEELREEYLTKTPLNNTLGAKQCVRNLDPRLPERMMVLIDGKKFVLCDTKTDAGGWIVIQRRVNGDIDFERGWNDYKNGFGSVTSDYWLGNDWISVLTAMGYNELRFDMTYKQINYYAVYRNFRVENEAGFYKTTYTFYGGNATDNFSYQNGMKFTTTDRDNDLDSGNCAQRFSGGWWYKDCFTVNVNGRWGEKKHGFGINWRGVSGHDDSMEFVEMKVRAL
ncbi:fibroleukin-like [Physella acuta]|uniref:fibroleukin-like n=1 Tax=Physella acuta TaxID=109671 RepID=UPI0027DBD7CA|nr:fibroleukin-like [Physella acuta]